LISSSFWLLFDEIDTAMLTVFEQAQLKKELKKFAGQSYAQVAAMLSERFGREISRSTVRYYLRSMDDYEGRVKGRPSGTIRDEEIWDQLLPELLALTGLSATHLYKALSQLVAPERLPLGRAAFHERTGVRTSAKVKAGGRREVPLLQRCRLRLKILETCRGDQTRTYLFGYEELTGYTAFNVISPAVPTLQAIEGFIKEVEDHLALPVRRVLLINMVPPFDGKAKKVIGIETECQKLKRATARIISPYQRSAEIDLLHRLTKKQNVETARINAAAIREAISCFVNQERWSGAMWQTPAQRAVTRRLRPKPVS
jgi:hypothetical protein